MPESQVFRCPFEVQGTKDDTIVTVTLFGNRALRLLLMRAALEQLHNDRTRTAVRFVLPDSVIAGCGSHTLLQKRIVPYQVEYLAASMDIGLAPFLPHHSRWAWVRARCSPRTRFRRLGAWALMHALQHVRGRTLSDFCNALDTLFKGKTKRGARYPEFIFGTLRRRQKEFYLIRLELAAFAIYQDQEKLDDPEHNDALFSIVKSPLYPPAFGRYSTRVEIVVTRDVDVVRLPMDSKRRIRTAANAVHMAHGIRIRDPETDQQGVGFWNLDDEK